MTDLVPLLIHLHIFQTEICRQINDLCFFQYVIIDSPCTKSLRCGREDDIGLIRERNLATGEVLEFEVSGDKIESVYMLPGWTHSIVNLSQTEDLVTVMTCNEVFDPAHPDTFSEPV